MGARLCNNISWPIIVCKKKKRERCSGEDGVLQKCKWLFIFYHNFNEIENKRFIKK